VASLALNLLTVGVISASLWQWRHVAEPANGGFPAQLLEFSRMLPGDRQTEVQGLITKNEPQMQPLREEVRRARHDAVQSFVAQPFDRDRFLATNGRLVEQELKLRQAQLGTIADISAKLSADERRAFIKWRRKNRPNLGRKPVDVKVEPPASQVGLEAKQQ
jgi:hypothetical protein